MIRLHVHTTGGTDTDVALRALDAELAAHPCTPRFILAFYGCEHDDARIYAWLQTRFPQCPVMGGSSSGGIMTHRGVTGPDAIGLMLIEDDEGDYGAAAAPLDGDAAAIAETLLEQALAACGCSGELPELIWIYQTPGHEEAVIEGLRRVVGDRCPIVGGSSADNDVSGHWRQLGPAGPMSGGLAVGVMFPSSRIGYAFQGGYEPAGPSGVVTGIGYKPAGVSGIVTATSGREIHTIDGRPAAEVYDGWIGHRIAGKLASGGSILADTTMCPLAIDGGRIGGATHYLLIHPEAVADGGALTTFRDVEVGTRIFAMKGDRQRLIERAGRVAAQARMHGAAQNDGTAGALVVYCGGCKLAVGEDIDRVAHSVSEALEGAPFLGCFTFGEQGHLAGRNVHGNLMISAVVFDR